MAFRGAARASPKGRFSWLRAAPAPTQLSSSTAARNAGALADRAVCRMFRSSVLFVPGSVLTIIGHPDSLHSGHPGRPARLPSDRAARCSAIDVVLASLASGWAPPPRESCFSRPVHARKATFSRRSSQRHALDIPPAHVIRVPAPAGLVFRRLGFGLPCRDCDRQSQIEDFKAIKSLL